MKIELYKKIIRDVFFCLLIITMLVTIYQFNSTIFSDIQLKFIIITIILGMVWFYLRFVCEKEIKIRVKEVKNVKGRIIIFLIGFIFYSFFLIWVYNSFSFNEFIFFILLLYVPISCILGLDSRIPIVICLFLLLICSISLFYKWEELTKNIAIYAYYMLSFGAFIILIDHLEKP